MLKKFFSIAAIILLLFVISDATASAEKAAKNEPAPYQGLDFASELKGPPQKIIPLYPQSLGLIYVLGIQKNVAGMPLAKVKISLHENGFFSQTGPEVGKMKDVGYPGMPNIETLIGLKADLIITPSNFHMKANKFFDKLKIPQFRVHGTFSNVSDWLSAVENFGKITGKTQEAKRYADYFKSKFEMARGRIKSMQPSKTIKTAHLVKMGPKYIAYGQKSSFVKSFLKELGCNTLGYSNKDSAETPISQEELIKFDPDYIFIESITHASGKQNVDLKEPFWKKLTAYKNERVFFVPVDDESCFLTGWYFNLAAPLGILWTAKTIYPEQFKDIDINAEADKFYREFINVDRRKMIEANKNIKSDDKKE